MKIIYTTIDDENKAKAIVENLLREKLAACINIFPVKSAYWWKDKIERSDEIAIIIKTKESLVDEAVEKIKSLHSYELPVIDVIDIEKLNKDAEKWLNEVTK